MNDAKSIKYFRGLMRDQCAGCRAKDYQGEKTYVTCNLYGTDFSAWLCRECNERLQGQAATCRSMGYCVVNDKEPT